MKAAAPVAAKGSRPAVHRGLSGQAGQLVGLRRAMLSDLEELMRLETTCFEDWRQDSRRVIRESLTNPRHEVWVVSDADGGGLTACLTLRLRMPRVRIYSIATDPQRQGSGLGRELMEFSRARARELGANALSLEADAARDSLTAWYERLGFRKTIFLSDFYAPGRHAWRMTAQLTGEPSALRPFE